MFDGGVIDGASDELLRDQTRIIFVFVYVFLKCTIKHKFKFRNFVQTA